MTPDQIADLSNAVDLRKRLLSDRDEVRGCIAHSSLTSLALDTTYFQYGGLFTLSHVTSSKITLHLSDDERLRVVALLAAIYEERITTVEQTLREAGIELT